jgi:hypothetical protein
VEPVRSQTAWWVYVLGVLVPMAAVTLLGVFVMRSQTAFLRGELVPVRTPDVAQTGGEMLSLDLGSRRLRRLVLGAKGKGQWKLPGWNGNAWLEPTADGQTRIVPEGTAGQVVLNGTPLIRPAILHDGDQLTLGAYRLRYDNLLQ